MKKKTITLYNLALPIIALLVIGGYVAVKQPHVLDNFRNALSNKRDAMENQEKPEQAMEKPDLEGTQEIVLTESQLNSMIDEKLGDIELAGNTITDANVSIDGENNQLTGTVSVSNGMTIEFVAVPMADKVGVEIVSLELAGEEGSTVFNLIKGTLRPGLQSAINRVIEARADSIQYIELRDQEVVIYVTAEAETTTE